MGYGQYTRRSLTTIARSARLTPSERLGLAGALLGHVLKLIYLHESPARRGARRVPAVGTRPTSFAKDADGVSALVSGWGEPEPWGTWSVAKECVLRLRLSLPAGRSPVRLGLRYRTIPFSQRRPRVVECALGGRTVQRWEFREDNYRGELVIEVPVHALDDSVELRLVNLNAQSPKELGIGEDLRTLGIGVEQIRLLE